MKRKQVVKMVLLLLILAAFVGAYLWMKGYNEKEEEKSESEEETQEVIMAIAADDISKISYTYEGVEYSFVYDEGWSYEADPEFSLDATYLETIVTELAGVTAERKLEENLDNAETYGLTEPQLTVTVWNKQGQDTTLYIGDCNTNTGNYYCYLKDETAVYMIGATLPESLQHKIEDMEAEETTEASAGEVTEEET